MKEKEDIKVDQVGKKGPAKWRLQPECRVETSRERKD
jgi:hypothetical protein